MDKFILIDGNSIINRAFYGIMGNKMLMLDDGTYTNAVYGFLAILFKNLEDIKPEYIAIAFDLKAPTLRHKMYDGYKATRKGMPNELAMQMPILKDALKAMNITIIEKEGYEADDILGTLAKWGQAQGLDVTVLTGDRDSFQLIDSNIKVRIPHTKMGKTETEDYTIETILEKYGLEPKDLIEVKALQGDTSDNIPGVPGIGEKTALSLIQEYKTIDKLYEAIDNNTDSIKGKTREKIETNRELAYLSRQLGTINLEAPIEKEMETFKLKDWDSHKVYELFKKLKFNRYIERFNLNGLQQDVKKEEVKITGELVEEKERIEDIFKRIKQNKKMFYFIETEKLTNSKELIINEKITSISIYVPEDEKTYTLDIDVTKELFENEDILKISYKQKEQFILLKQIGIEAQNLMFDVAVAGYVLNSTISKYTLEYLSDTYLEFNILEYLENSGDNTSQASEQINLFETEVKKEKISNYVYANVIYKLYEALTEKLKEINCLELFQTIEMPLVEVLALMQYEGMYVDKEELVEFGVELQNKINILTKEIYELCGQEFNINSTKQLGEILFEKLKLPMAKKTKTGYSTDVEVLEKIRNEHPVIEKILEYRQLVKLNSTYVEGLIPYINPITKRIHSSFHQTVTATGRISSTEPNLQNIPTRMELGKKLRKVFKVDDGKIFIDADYSQIELRILAHISEDENMIEAFKNDEDIHAQAASKVFNIPINEVSKEERSKAKAVNFGIVYGISDFGLGEQIGVSRKKAKEYIEQYLEKYKGIKQFMNDITDKTKELGYVETLFHRRRYVPEISSNNYMVRQFGARVAMNTPIQGTAADIMKIAMIHVYEKLKQNKLQSKLILQVHDELLIETKLEEKEEVEKILRDCMENVIALKIPLKVELEEGYNWYEAK